MTTEEVLSILQASGGSQRRKQRQTFMPQQTASQYNEMRGNQQNESNTAALAYNQALQQRNLEESAQTRSQQQTSQYLDRTRNVLGNALGIPMQRQGMMLVNGEQIPSMRAVLNAPDWGQLESRTRMMPAERQLDLANRGLTPYVGGTEHSKMLENFAKIRDEEENKATGHAHGNLISGNWFFEKDPTTGLPRGYRYDVDTNASPEEQMKQKLMGTGKTKIPLNPYQLSYVKKALDMSGHDLSTFLNPESGKPVTPVADTPFVHPGANLPAGRPAPPPGSGSAARLAASLENQKRFPGMSSNPIIANTAGMINDFNANASYPVDAIANVGIGAANALIKTKNFLQSIPAGFLGANESVVNPTIPYRDMSLNNPNRQSLPPFESLAEAINPEALRRIRMKQMQDQAGF